MTKINFMKATRKTSGGYYFKNIRGASIFIPNQRIFGGKVNYDKNYHVKEGEAHEI